MTVTIKKECKINNGYGANKFLSINFLPNLQWPRP